MDTTLGSGSRQVARREPFPPGARAHNLVVRLFVGARNILRPVRSALGSGRGGADHASARGCTELPCGCRHVFCVAAMSRKMCSTPSKSPFWPSMLSLRWRCCVCATSTVRKGSRTFWSMNPCDKHPRPVFPFAICSSETPKPSVFLS